MNEHELKIFSNFFEDVVNGDKTFELRKNDRNYKVGDILILKEFKIRIIDSTHGEEVVVQAGGYTGREIRKRISYILTTGGKFGLHRNYCILGIKDI